MKRIIKIIILAITISSFIGAFFCLNYIRRTTIDNSHIFVCDNPNHHSDFDNWLLKECNVKSVPTYLVIKNNYVIGIFPGNISESEFTNYLGTCLINDINYYSLPDYMITNLNKKSYTLSNISKEDYYILEISWIDCDDCKNQDKYYTNKIYYKYTTNQIYRYYINSEFNKVYNKYN